MILLEERPVVFLAPFEIGWREASVVRKPKLATTRPAAPCRQSRRVAM